MLALIRLIRFVVPCCALFALAANAFAVYSITNGGFDAQDASVNNNATVTPTGWFNASNAVNSFSDNILNVQSGVATSITNAGGATVGAWDANGYAIGRDAPFGVDGTLEQSYLYQRIGTYAGEPSVSVSGFVFNRTNGNRVGNFDVSFYYTPGATAGAVGTDLTSLGGTLIGASKVLLEGTDFPAITGGTAQSATWSHSVNFAGSGITNGSAVWFRIGDSGNPDALVFDEPILDNINITGCGLGDVNCNGTVTVAADFTPIRDNFRKIVASRSLGDLDGSGDVDMLDYLQFRRAFLGGGGSAASIPSLAVPEPGSLALLLLSAIGGVGYLVRRGGSLATVMALIAMVSALAVAQPAAAIDNLWSVPAGNWNTPGNWSTGGVPSIAFEEVAVIDNGGTATVSATPPAAAGGIVIGQGAGTTGTLSITAGTLTSQVSASTNGVVTIGAAGTGTLIMTGGTLNATANLAQGANVANVINLSGTATVTTPVAFLRGTTRITGPTVNFTASATALFEDTHVLVANITAATHSAIKSPGPITVTGALNAEFTGVTPAFGATYNVVDALAISGTFNNAANVPVIGVTAPVLGEVYRVRSVNGGQGRILQLIHDRVLTLEVNRDTGAVSILNPLNGGITIDGYSITSAAGSLEPANGNWNSLTDQGTSGFQEAGPTATSLSELNASGSLNFGASARSIGNAFDDGNAFNTLGLGGNGRDLVFRYSTPGAAGEIIQGQVQYTGVGKTNTMLLTIDPTTGAARLKNDNNVGNSLAIDSYSILSTGGALLTGNLLDAATGTITAAAGNTANAISELAATPGTSLSAAGGGFFDLGNIFNTSFAQEGISLEFTIAGQNRVYTGAVRFEAAAVVGVSGDYNNNGVVDAADYTVWRDKLGANVTLTNEGAGITPGVVTIEDYNHWKTRFGATSGSGSASSASVPEPTSLLLVACGLVVAGVMRRRSGR